MDYRKLLAIMGAVKSICYASGPRITKADRAYLRKRLRQAGYSLDEVKVIEHDFYKEL
jgi:hypothetical protein